jgi:hypothetical protein
MKRTLQDWANLAEIIGNAAIIISLVFVGLQISDNTREMRSAAAHNATVALQAWYVEVGTNEQAAQVFRKGMSDPTTLSKDEALQFLMNVHSALIAYQSVRLCLRLWGLPSQHLGSNGTGGSAVMPSRQNFKISLNK